MAISLNTFLERNFEIIKIKIYFDLSSQITYVAFKTNLQSTENQSKNHVNLLHQSQLVDG